MPRLPRLPHLPRTARRSSAAVLPALTTAAPVGPGPTTTSAQAADSTPGYSLQHITVQVHIGPANQQACTVDADLYRPDGASPTNRKPAILTTNGFGGSKDDSNESAIGRGFVRQGYVVLAYTGLGFPSSGCKITLDDPDYDGRAGKQLVDVLAGTSSYRDGAGRSRRLRV